MRPITPEIINVKSFPNHVSQQHHVDLRFYSPQTDTISNIIIIIIIIVWLDQWTLLFPQATSIPVDFVLKIGSFCQSNVEWSDIGFNCPEPSFTRTPSRDKPSFIRLPKAWSTAIMRH